MTRVPPPLFSSYLYGSSNRSRSDLYSLFHFKDLRKDIWKIEVMEGVEIPPRSVVDLEGSKLEYSDLFVPRRLPFKRKNKFRDGKRYWKRLKQISTLENNEPSTPNLPKYATIEAGPSLYPAKKYCDLTGQVAKYVDPKTKLRYANKELFAVVRSLPNDVVQGMLAIRNAHVVLR